MTAHSNLTAPAKPKGWWWKVLLFGAALWMITLLITIFTENEHLIATLILLGSFLVPLAVVLFAAEQVRGTLTPLGLMLAFTVGGIIGMLGASLLELNLQATWYIWLLVAFAEELVKGIIFVVAGRNVVPKNAYQGALLGATVGAGFAAFESAGYAFTAVIGKLGTIDLIALVQTEILRAVLAPFGHILWTAILGAAIFAAAQAANRYRFSWSIVGAFASIVLLHALWNSMSFIASWITVQWLGLDLEINDGLLDAKATAEALNLQSGIYGLGLTLVSLAGILLLNAFIGTPRASRRTKSSTPAGMR